MIPFYKMHANGNDFLIIDGFYHNISLPSRAILRQWADRHRGIGFDQLLYFTSDSASKDVDAVCRIFNASGSEATQCGHGIACLAQFLYKQGYIHRDICRIAVPSGVCRVQRIDNQLAIVDLGYPIFEPKQVPFLANQPKLVYPIEFFNFSDALFQQQMDEMRRFQQVFLKELSHPELFHLLQGFSLKNTLFASVISIGNPHCVILVKDFDTIPETLGKQFSEHPLFPKGCNVEFMQVVSPDVIRLKTYERGVGQNQACGSGACAAVVAGRLLSCLNPRVSVQFPSGDQVTVTWADFNATVQLETLTHLVFQGELSFEV